MPITKSALIRYQVIDRCLRDVNKQWTLNEIIDEVNEYLVSELGYKKGISKRTIEYDLNFMQSPEGFSAPIEKEKAGENWYWYYTDRKFSITKSPLDRSDAEKLNEALLILKQFENFPQFDEIQEIILKLESKAITSNKKHKSVIQFQTNSLASGNRHLKELYKIVLHKKVLELIYQPFGKPDIKVVVSPYLLKEYNDRWYLIGKNHQNNFIQNFPLDRIKSFEERLMEFKEDSSFDAEDFFKDIIGVSVTQNANPEKIILSFTAEQGNYIRTKPLHSSQRIIKDNKKELQIELTLIPNYELKKLIWSFGDSVKVIKPKNLI